MTKRDRVLFSYRADATAPIGKVIKFLGSNQPKLRRDRQRKEKAIEAICAFLLPYALAGNKEDAAVIQKAAEQSVRALLRQIETICLDFGLEVPRSALTVLSAPFPVSIPAGSIVELDQSSSASIPEPERASGIWLDGVDVDLNELLGDLL